VKIRRLGPGDEGVVERLATRQPPGRARELLADERTLFFVAFEADDPVAFVLAYELIRRHGDESIIFVYEVDVEEPYRQRGIASALMRELAQEARARDVREGFVLTDRANEPAMRLYESVGGVDPTDTLMWEFRYTDD
jgi:ribosomal protein S18 acetylase RimI-like enzyme